MKSYISIRKIIALILCLNLAAPQTLLRAADPLASLEQNRDERFVRADQPANTNPDLVAGAPAPDNSLAGPLSAATTVIVSTEGTVQTGTIAFSGIVDNLIPPLSDEQKTSILQDYDESQGYTINRDDNGVLTGYSWDSKTKPGYSYELNKATDTSGERWVVLTHAPIQQEIPQVVTDFVKNLQSQIGAGFQATTVRQDNGTYLVTVTAVGTKALEAPTSGLKTMSFSISADGAEESIKMVDAVYYGKQGDIHPNTGMLFEAFRGTGFGGRFITAVSVSLGNMTRANVTDIKDEATGTAIYLTYNDKTYKIRRDAAGQLYVEKVVVFPDGAILLTDEEKTLIHSVLGVPRPALDYKIIAPSEICVDIADCPVTESYFTAGNVFVGSKTVTGEQTTFENSDRSRIYNYGKLVGRDRQGVSGMTFNFPGHAPVHVDLDYTNASQFPADLKAIEAAVRDLVARGSAATKMVMKNYHLDSSNLGETNSMPGRLFGSNKIMFALESDDLIFHYSVNHTVQDNKYTAELLLKEMSAVAKMKEAVKAGLSNTLEFNREQLEQWIKDGHIVIDIDRKNLTAKVTFASTMKLPEGAVNLFNPLGSNQLPNQINFNLAKIDNVMGEPCMLGHPCPDFSVYYLNSGVFKLNSLTFNLNYTKPGIFGIPRFPEPGDNRLYSISITEVNDPCNGNPDCMAPMSIKLIKDISFAYGNDGKIKAHIVYHNELQGAVASRDLVLAKMGSDQYHIESILDMDKDGKMIVKNVFSYHFITTDQACPLDQSNCNTTLVRLDKITRTDASGNLLSAISDIRRTPVDDGAPDFMGYIGTQTFPGGAKHEMLPVATFEEMLAQAMKNEAENNPQQEIAAVTATIREDLMKSFGFSDQAMNDLIASGKIKIAVNIDKLHAYASVSIDPSVVPSPNALNLVNLLGNPKLPEKIAYRLGQNPMPSYLCAQGMDCLPPTPTYHLISGSFRIGDEFKADVFDIDYFPGDVELHSLNRPGDNRLYSVKVTRMDNPCGNNPDCMAPTSLTPLKDISFAYDNNQIKFTAHIVYHDGSQGNVKSRDITLVKMADNKPHFQTITEMDKDGNIIANNIFTYIVSTTEQACPPDQSNCNTTLVRLDKITRDDGKTPPDPLSTIGAIELNPTKAVLLPQPVSYHATQTLADGTVISLSFATFEEMLAQAMKNEAMQTDTLFTISTLIRDPSQQILTITVDKKGWATITYGTVNYSALFIQDGNFLNFTAGDNKFEFRFDNNYSITSMKHTYKQLSNPLVTQVHSYAFANGRVISHSNDSSSLSGGSEDYIKETNHYAYDKNGKLQSHIHDYSRQQFQNGALKMNRTVREIVLYADKKETLRVSLENKLSNEDAYSKATITGAGTFTMPEGFKATATLQLDGSVIFNMVDTKNHGMEIMNSASGLESVSVTFLSDGQLNPESIAAAFYGSEKNLPVHGRLLFDAMRVCPYGDACQYMKEYKSDLQVLEEMAQVSVVKIEDGKIYFTTPPYPNDTVYLAYRVNGNVVREIVKEIPQAVTDFVNSLKGQVGDGFKVTAALQQDGTYQIKTDLNLNCPEGHMCEPRLLVTGSFTSMHFNVDQNGTLARDSIHVFYADFQVDGKLLFDALSQEDNLEGIQSKMAFYSGYILGKMTHVFINSVDESGAIFFRRNDKNYRVSIENGVVKLIELLVPFTTSVSLSADDTTRKDLTVNVHEDGTVDVNLHGSHYDAGVFDKVNNSIIISPFPPSVWTFKLNHDASGYSLASMEQVSTGGVSSSLATHSFNRQGALISASGSSAWDNRFGKGSTNSQDSYTYIEVNGKLVLQSRNSTYAHALNNPNRSYTSQSSDHQTFSYAANGNQIASSTTTTYSSNTNGLVHNGQSLENRYFDYDSQGNQTMSISVSDVIDNGIDYHFAYYTKTDRTAGQTTLVRAQDLTVSMLEDVKSTQDSGKIDAKALVKHVTFYKENSTQDYPLSVEYVNDGNGNFTARKATKAGGQTQIVVGNVDVLSGGQESDDVVFSLEQSFNGYSINYGQGFKLDDKGNVSSAGYGLVFSVTVENAVSGSIENAVAVVDYKPGKDNTVMLGGKNYRILIEDGLAKLTELLVPFTASARTNPNYNFNDLIVEVAADGTAKVTKLTTKYSGIFNPQTNMVIVNTGTSTLTLALETTPNGTRRLTGFTESYNAGGSSVARFSPEGLVIFAGFDGLIKGKSFYAYDTNQKLVQTIKVEIVGNSYKASYVVKDLSQNRMLNAEIFSASIEALFNTIDTIAPANQLSEARKYIPTETGFYFSGPQMAPNQYLYSIEFTKDLNELFTVARRVMDKTTKVFIVHGLPDVLSGGQENNDEYFIDNQTSNNYLVVFGSTIDSTTGMPFYGLIFYEKVTPGAASSIQAANADGVVIIIGGGTYTTAGIANYPQKDTVAIKGINYRISIENGVVKLADPLAKTVATPAPQILKTTRSLGGGETLKNGMENRKRSTQASLADQTLKKLKNSKKNF